MNSVQAASTVFMVRPATIYSNPETAGSNSFQKDIKGKTRAQILETAQHEFDTFVTKLQNNGVEVLVFQDTEKPEKPDAVFPNNWISFHEGGLVITYPMMAVNRRVERQPEIFKFLHQNGYPVSRHWNISHYETDNEFLEGTGSIVFDYDNRLAYANKSPRTNYRLLDLLCKELDYKAVKFRAIDRRGDDIYHTNVVMGIGHSYAILCLECIREGREALVHQLEKTGKKIIAISFDQMASFAGNVMQVYASDTREYFTLISQTAWDSLRKEQQKVLQDLNIVLPISIPTIETLGGGSVRCMVAGVFF